MSHMSEKKRKKRECVHVSSFGKASATHGKGYVTTCWTIAAIVAYQGDIKKILIGPDMHIAQGGGDSHQTKKPDRPS